MDTRIFRFKGINGESASTVEINADELRIHPPIEGFCKVYYSVYDVGPKVSHRFRDFSDRPLDRNLLEIQKQTGFIPYPLTILKGVYKAPPGLTTTLKKSMNGSWSAKYSCEPIADLLASDGSSLETFRRRFESVVDDLRQVSKNDVACSYSGGFDSCLLLSILKDRVKYILNYSENENESMRMRSMAKKVVPGAVWLSYAIPPSIEVRDLEEYFDAIDEPCCDPAGLAEFLMVRNAIKNYPQIKEASILNGQGADTIFANDRAYYKEYLLSFLFGRRKWGWSPRRHVKTDTYLGKAMDYFKSTRARFHDHCGQHSLVNTEHQAVIDAVLDAYTGGLNLDRVNFFGLMDFLLFSSNYGLEKIKTTSRALNLHYLVPFVSSQMIRLAMSIEGRRKVGYRGGKKILKKEFSDIVPKGYVSQAFIPKKAWKTICGAENVYKYREYFISRWTESAKIRHE